MKTLLLAFVLLAPLTTFAGVSCTSFVIENNPKTIARFERLFAEGERDPRKMKARLVKSLDADRILLSKDFILNCPTTVTILSVPLMNHRANIGTVSHLKMAVQVLNFCTYDHEYFAPGEISSVLCTTE